MKGSSWGRDVLSVIFGFLEPEDLLRCRLVCSQWCRVASSDALWETHLRELDVCIVDNKKPLFRRYIRATLFGLRTWDMLSKERRNAFQAEAAAFMASDEGRHVFRQAVENVFGMKAVPSDPGNNKRALLLVNSSIPVSIPSNRNVIEYSGGQFEPSVFFSLYGQPKKRARIR